MKFLSFFTLVLLFILPGCLNEPDLKEPFSSFQPVQLNDGWEIAAPTEAGIDSAGLAAVFRDFHSDEDVWQVRSLTVFRHGKLVAESYTKDFSDRTTKRAMWSCTKQVMGVLVGIAVDKGLIDSIDDTIDKYLPGVMDKYPNKKGITIKDLLTMRSGLNFDNYGLSGDDSQILQQEPDNLLDFVLGKELIYEPGTEFKYKDSDPQILSSVLERVTGIKTDLWAEQVLFQPLGVNNIEWLRYKDGATLGSFGIMTTPRELAKIPQMVLNGGTYNNSEIVSSSWIDDMTAPQVEAGDKHFGYLWWNYPEHNTYFMSGNGRQLFFVFPEKDLIVAITSEPNLQGKFNLNTATGRKYGQRIEALCD